MQVALDMPTIRIIAYIIVLSYCVSHKLTTHSERVLLHTSFRMNKIDENITYEYPRVTTLTTHIVINNILYARTLITSIFGVLSYNILFSRNSVFRRPSCNAFKNQIRIWWWDIIVRGRHILNCWVGL